MAEAERAGEEERKKLVRQLQLRWHPGRYGRWQQRAGRLADGWSTALWATKDACMSSCRKR